MGLAAPVAEKQRLGDTYFRGVNMRLSPEVLEPGFVSDAKNARFNRGVPETRLGTMVYPWLNNITSNGVGNWGTIYGTGRFNDPNSFQDYQIIAADGNVYVCFPWNYPVAMTLPSGVTITQPVTFTQAFDTLIMHRGFDAAALKCDGPDQPWEFIGQSDQYIPGASIANIPPYAEFVITEAQGVVKSGAPPAGAPFVIVDGGPFISPTVTIISGDSRLVRSASGINYDTVFNGTITVRFTPSPAWQPGERHSVQFVWTTVRGSEWIDNGDGTYSVNGLSAGNQFKTEVYETTYVAGPGQFVAGTSEIPRVKRSIFHQNRLILLGKNDELYLSDFNDYTRYQPVLQALRINQGSSDRCVNLVKFNDTTIVVFKDRSIYAVNNAYGTFSEATLDLITDQFGLAAPESVAHCGNDLIFLSEHGVMSLKQTEQNKLQCVSVPLSDPIQPLIDRINWKYAADAFGAYWENKYYLAVPLDEAEQLGPELIQYQQAYDGNPPFTTVIPVTSGASYRYEKGDFTDSLTNGTEVLTFSGDFIAQGSSVTLTGNSDSIITDSLKRVYRGINNAILVYDFLNQAWAGYDQETGLIVKRMFSFPMDERMRLFITTHEGYVKIYEEDYEDQLSLPTATLTVSSAPANGKNIRVNGGTIVTSNTALNDNSGTDWATSSATVAKNNIFSNLGKAIRSFNPTATSPWTAPNTFPVATTSNQSVTGVVTFYGTNGVVPRVTTNNQSVLSLSRADTLATCTTLSTHGASVGDTVVIYGANQSAYNGTHIITAVPSADAFRFTVYGSPTTPATGTITCGIEMNATTATWGTVVEEQQQQIEFSLTTRAYTHTEGDMASYPWLSVDMQTWNPLYSIDVIQPGAEEVFSSIEDRTKDPRIFDRPFDAAAYTLTNADGRFMNKWRQDYAIKFGSGETETTGIDSHTTTDGIRCDLHQDSRETIHLQRVARSLQVRITNSTGRMRVMAVLLDTKKKPGPGYPAQ